MLKIKSFNLSSLLIIIMFVIITALTYFLIKKDNNIQENNYEETIHNLEEDIKVKELKIKQLNIISDSLTKSTERLTHIKDSLETQTKKVKIVYVDMYKKVNTANHIALDSIIRANW